MTDSAKRFPVVVALPDFQAFCRQEFLVPVRGDHFVAGFTLFPFGVSVIVCFQRTAASPLVKGQPT
jgi:hypothetical protein